MLLQTTETNENQLKPLLVYIVYRITYRKLSDRNPVQNDTARVLEYW